MTTVRGWHFATDQAISLSFEAGRVTAVEADPNEGSADQRASVVYLAPGLVDLQVNGIEGREFIMPGLTVDDVIAMCRAMPAYGVSRFCPTVTTSGFDQMQACLREMARAVEQDGECRRMVAGFHVEGPYISPADGPRGAHPLEHCREPSDSEFERLQDAAQGEIRLLTLSPEYPESERFIKRIVATGVHVAIGHTSADSDQIRRAVDAGATLSTHLGNGAHGQMRRHPNYIWDQLADDRLSASMIVDGHHLPPSVVKSFVRCKSTARVILVSDITGMAGLPPGKYESSSLGAVEVLEDGRLVVAGQRQYLAGAARPLFDSLANAINFADVSIRDAVRMASIQPAEYIGCAVNRFVIGDPADLIAIEAKRTPGGAMHCRLQNVWSQGRPVDVHPSLA